MPVRLGPGLPSKAAYRPDIEGLRCIAVLLVVLFHFGLPDALRGGFIGVDIFFVISGYLIIPPIINKLHQNSFSFAEFYERRIRRLAPALVATTTITMVAGLIVLTPQELVRLAKETIACQLYISNVYYWRYLNYFGLQSQQAFLLHTWSLGVEEQFYLTCPFLLWAAAKLAPSQLLKLLIVVGLSSFALNVMAVSWKPEATFYLFPTRAWEFAAGALVPQLTRRISRSRVLTRIFGILGIALLVCSLAFYEPTSPFPGWYAALPVVGTASLLVAGSDHESFYCRIISAPPLRYLGRISYELYLVHWPIRIFLPLLVFQVSYFDRIAAVLLSIALAAAIYHLIEAPIRGRGVLGRATSLVTAYLGATASLIMALLLIIETGGLAGRFSAGTVTVAAAEGDVDTAFRACESRTSDPCVIGAPNTHPSWLVYGDSHADALARSFSAYLAARHQSAFFSFQSGCMPVVGGGDNNCRHYNEEVLRFVATHSDVETIALVSTWQLHDGFIDDRDHFVQGRAAQAAFVRSLERTLNDYNNRRIVFWLPVPGARSAVPSGLARNAMLRRHWDLRISRADYDNRTAFLTSLLRARSNVSLIDPAKHLCASGMCQVTGSGRPLYYDNAHPAASQAGLFESFIEEDLQMDDERRRQLKALASSAARSAKLA